MFRINTKQIAHIVTQARAKQLATKSIQDKLLKIITEYQQGHHDISDISDRELEQRLLQIISEFYNTSVSINNYLEGQELNKVGYPIKNNKTHLQLNMAKEWSEEREGSLIAEILEGKHLSQAV